MTPTLRIRHYTDPGCPFAFSAEPVRLRLRWLFGDQIEWEDRMVVLSHSVAEYEEKGMTTERAAAGARRLQRAHGMPIDTSERTRLHATEPACRAVVAARLNAPETAEPLLRHLRIRTMAGGLLDDPELIDAAAEDAGIDPGELARWMGEDATHAALAEDEGEARDPSAQAVALSHKLASAGDGWRYTCPSYEIERVDGEGDAVSVPGFQPFGTYEVAFAHLAPELERHAAPESAAELLDWAGGPLASAEVAEILGVDRPEAREALAPVGVEHPVGAEGWWRAEVG